MADASSSFLLITDVIMTSLLLLKIIPPHRGEGGAHGYTIHLVLENTIEQ